MKYIGLSKPFRVAKMEAHAFQRKEVLACIGGYRKNLRRHLLKLVACADDTSRKHWLKEIQNFVDEMTDFSLKKGCYLSKEAAYNQLVGGNHGNLDLEESVKNMLEGLGKDYILRKDVDPKQIAAKLYLVYDSLAQAIESKFSSVEKKIDVKQILEDTGYFSIN